MWMSKLWKVCFVIVFLAESMTSGLFAQSQQAISAEPPVPTIRVNTRLVLVDVVVTDKNGNRVQGLKPEDFALQEKGKNQKISLFTSAAENKQATAPKLPPGIYSNKPEYRSPGGPVVVILLDAVNTPFKDQAYARQQMLDFVRDQYKPGQRTAVLTLSNSLGVLQDFTEDPEVLLQALKSYKPKEQESTGTITPRPASVAQGRESAGGSIRTTDVAADRILRFQQTQVAYVEERRIQMTLEGMRGLARCLGGIPGRKSVIWVTAAFPFNLIPDNRAVSDAEMAESLPTISQLSLDTRSSGAVANSQRNSHTQEIREAAAQLSSTQVAIYPVDARGLISGMEGGMEDVPARRFQSMDDSALSRISDVTASQETMKEMARETGGIAYVNQNEIKQGVALAMNDSLAYYTLGYYPDDKKWDGKYRPIKIKVNRDGTEARYRKGYFAIDPSEKKDRKPEQEVAEALQDQAPATLVTFSAQVKPAEKTVGVDFLVDPTTISAEDSSGGKKINMALYAAMFSPDGKMVGNKSMKVDQTFDGETYTKILQQGMLLHIDLDQAPGKDNEVRLAVRDSRTGNVGTLAAPVNPR
jgi:VWFA-related protein